VTSNHSNMNMYERSTAICYLLARDGYCCNNCDITVKELIKQAKLKEETTGESRKLPLLIVDCKDNIGSHRVDIYNSVIMSKLQLICWPCNRYKNLHKPNISQSVGPHPTREKKDALCFEPAYHRNLQIFLLDNEHGCQAEIQMNGREFSEGANQVTTKRYFEDKLHTNTNKKGKYQLFPFNCESQHCNGNHICLTESKPIKLLDAEHHKLESIWFVEYGDKRETWKNYHFGPFIELDEYVKTHCVLLAHDFK